MNEKSQKIADQLTEIEQKWIDFLIKIEQRMEELSLGAIPELEQLFKTDEDQFKRTYGRMLSSIIGQLNSIEEKVSEVEQKNIRKPINKIEDKVEDMDNLELSRFVDSLSERCSKRGEEFERKLKSWVEKVEATGQEDFEIKYQAILDEYQEIKDKFCCQQCSSPIPINKVLFIITHLTCPACQTQNTFVPSSRASELDHVGMRLAEQRTKHILDAHEDEKENERRLYYQIHELDIEKIGYEISKNRSKIEELNEKIAILETQRRASIARAPELYKEYLRAKFDEWKKLVPELADQNQRIYDGLLARITK